MSLLNQYIAYIKENPQNYWFKAKLYGWGWTPATWQGWLVTLVYVILLSILASTIDEDSPKNEVIFMFVLPAVLLTMSFLRIAYKTGEKPSWNWGKPKPKQ